jgi:hypothetical protein
MPDLTPAEYEAAVAEEYGQFVAEYPINFDGVLAYAEGAPVPASNVAKYKYDEQGLVKRIHTPGAAAKAAKTEKGA